MNPSGRCEQPATTFGAAWSRFRLALTIGWTEPVELFSSAMTAGWGLQLMVPYQPDTFDAAPSFRLFDALARWMEMAPAIRDGEAVIGAFCVLMGVGSFVATMFGMSRLRLIAQYACVGWWIFALMMVATANPTLPGLAFYVGQVAMRLWTALRLTGILRRPHLGLFGECNAPD